MTGRDTGIPLNVFRQKGIGMSNTEFSSILNGKIIYEKFPMNKLKRVDRPSTLITDNVQRTDSRNNAFVNAHRGDYGQAVAREASHAATKDPLGNSLADVRRFVANNVPNEIFPTPAPIPHDPDILTRHIKRLGYFLSADIMAVSHVPDYAIYSHDMQGNEINLIISMR